MTNYKFFGAFIASLLLFSQSALAIYRGVDLPEAEYPEIFQVLSLQSYNIRDVYEDLDSYCTGVAISDRIIVTAGHCVPENNRQVGSRLLVAQNGLGGKLNLYHPLSVKTPYDHVPTPDMYPEKASSPGYVEGCYEGPVPLIQTPNPDVAFIYFPPKTFKSWVKLDSTPINPGETVQMYGFGHRDDTAISGGLTMSLHPKGLAVSNSVIWDRSNSQRIAVINKMHENYADSGDSGGPVLRRGKLVGILATRENKCETPLGEDYAIVNTIIRTSVIKELLVKEMKE